MRRTAGDSREIEADVWGLQRLSLGHTEEERIEALKGKQVMPEFDKKFLIAA
jgi:hypothetical protein